MLLVRSLISDFLMYLLMLVMGIVCLPGALWSRDATYGIMRTYCKAVFWLLRNICGLRTEIRGTPPTTEVVIAAKHQSFLDIMMIFAAVPRAKFVMKKSLRYVPIFGQYAMRIGSIPVDRGKRSAAMKDMVERAETNDPGQTVIYPQGTRVAPGVDAPYKIGAGVLYQRLDQPCIPVATNAGVFWGRNSLFRRPGVAVVEFLDEVPQGLEVPEFIDTIKAVIEPASDRLREEAQAKL